MSIEAVATEILTYGTSGNAPLTTKLNNGVEVLAKLYNGEPSAMTFANRTQALNAARKYGGWVWQSGRPFFVRFDR